jgi:hypothetical protein
MSKPKRRSGLLSPRGWGAHRTSEEHNASEPTSRIAWCRVPVEDSGRSAEERRGGVEGHGEPEIDATCQTWQRITVRFSVPKKPSVSLHALSRAMALSRYRLCTYRWVVERSSWPMRAYSSVAGMPADAAQFRIHTEPLLPEEAKASEVLFGPAGGFNDLP